MAEKAAEAGNDLATSALKRTPPRRLLARLPFGVISVDRELRVDYANPAAHVFIDGIWLGMPLPEFSVRTFARRLHSSTRPARRIVKTSGGCLLELDGIPGGEGESALLLVQEVTSRERRQRVEREFASNTAHELRTPIAAITGALEALQTGAKEVPEDRDLFLGHIERETARLGRLVEALLLLARVQIGQEQPALRLVDVAPLLDEVAADLEPQNDVSVRVECEPGLATLTDYDLLRQAIWNIAANAVGHTVSGEIRLAGRDLGRWAEIEVVDSGPGIAPGDQGQIFDPFFRGKRRVGTGFGLGLPIAKEIARALGGTLDLDSEPGVGTRVRIRMPSARRVE
jgi:two-component system, OmpR family, sensor histidine kinase VicK